MRTAFNLVLIGLTALVVSPVDGAEQAMMKAEVIHAYGGPEVMKLEDVPRPEPKDDEILIRVIAASVNPVDVIIRRGFFAELVGKFPIIPGMDAAGIVERTGSKVTKFKKGDPVFAFFTLMAEGGYAEFVTAKANSEVAVKPQSVTFAQAAAVGATGSTAYEALIDEAKLSAGQTVLIHGGAGGVGHMAIQIAKARGAKVIATGSTAHQDFIKKMGADVAIDYTKTKFEDVARDVDVVLDAVGRSTLERSYGVVKKGGVIISIADEPNQSELDARGIRGMTLRSAPEGRVMEELAKLMAAKKLNPVVSQTFSLSDVVKAQDQIATRHTEGKIVLQVSPEPKG